MTGGQPIDGELTPQQITHQMYHERVARIVLMSDHPEALHAPQTSHRAPEIRHRDDIDAVMLAAARGAGRHRHRLRADLRRRIAPQAQAGHGGGPRYAALDQSGGLRRLWRLFGAVELHRDRARWRPIDGPQAPDQPIDLQQGLFLPQGVLPVLRDGARRQALRKQPDPDAVRMLPRCPHPALPEIDRGLEPCPCRCRWHRGADHQCDSWHGRPCRRQDPDGAGHGGSGAEGRRGDEPCPDFAPRPSRGRPPHRGGQADLLLGADSGGGVVEGLHRSV